MLGRRPRGESTGNKFKFFFMIVIIIIINKQTILAWKIIPTPYCMI